jgi:Tfp pilus assembly protein PilV
MQNKYSYTQGYCLIEVLLSLCLVNIILLGLADIANKGLQFCHSVNLYSVAAYQTYAAGEVLRAGGELSIWQREQQDFLPEAKVKISNSHEFSVVTIRWYDSYRHSHLKLALVNLR